MGVLLAAAAPASADVVGAEGFEAAVSPVPVREDPLDEWRTAIRDPRASKRRSAVRHLAQFGTREAWELVVEALADPESEVADEAQWRLVTLADRDLQAELLGRRGLRGRDESVALRLAEAFGRWASTVDGEELARALSSKDPRLSRQVLASIEELDRAGRLGGRRDRIARAVVPFTRTTRDHELKGTALCTLARLRWEESEQVSRLVAEGLGDRRAPVRCAALAAALAGNLPRALDWSRSMAGDEDRAVRIQALRNLAALRRKEALLVLVERLEVEPQLRVRWHLVDALQRLSGFKYRMDARPWRLWAEGQPEGGPPRRRPQENGSEERAGGAGATRSGGLAGLPILSDRVSFLFDFSGSMWTEMSDGRRPKDVVAKKLRIALEGLPEETEFNLVPFTYDPIPWEEQLVPARPSNVRRALEFFDRCDQRGRGNFYDAAVLALADERVDTLVVLTDGVPTGGLHSNLDLILELLEERNRFRHVAFDSILVDAHAGIRRRWAELATRTGGRSIEVDLELVE